MRTARALLLLLAAAGSAQAQEAHGRVYEQTRESVVAIRCEALGKMGERSGTGVFIAEDGTILTSYSVCPEGAANIRVWTAGPRLYASAAGEVEVLGHSEQDEVTLLRLRPKKEEKFRPVELGRSSSVQVGDAAYTSGNAANSIVNDDQPSFSAGLVSGVYRLREKRAGAKYAGLVIETTAAVNVGMEGAPLFDREGRMTGFITLNYSPNRFLGCAIPIDAVRAAVEVIRKRRIRSDAAQEDPGGEGWLGLTLREEKGRVVVGAVDPKGPADKAGLMPGDVVVSMGETPIASVQDFWSRVKGLKAGAIVFVEIEVEGERDEVRIELERKPE